MYTKKGEFLSNTSEDTNVIFYFEGGPGYSSQYSAYDYLGPFYIDSDLEVQYRKESWNNLSLLVFIDQPLNVGFSFTDSNVNITTTEQSGDHFINFLENFYKYYPKLKKNPTYFSGESYAGHYVPCYAYKLLQNQLFIDVNFLGVLIAGPWVEAQIQDKYYSQFYYTAGIASYATRKELRLQEINITNLFAYKDYNMITTIDNELTDTDNEFYGYVDQDNFDVNTNNLDLEDYTSTWLDDPDTKKMYGVPEWINYNIFNDTIYDLYAADMAISYKKYLNYLLNNNYNVILYNGQNDIEVTPPGVTELVNTFSWSKIQNWKIQRKGFWQRNGQTVGTIKKYDNFVFAIVYNSGHMVSYYQPMSGYEILNRTINWYWDMNF